MRKNGQKGFTLVELLVVIGIIATLGAVVIPNVGRFVAPAHATANDDEFGNVQAAMDTYIAETRPVPPLVAANAVAASDFSATTPVLYPGYMRDPNTRCSYTWDTSGQITQAGCP